VTPYFDITQFFIHKSGPMVYGTCYCPKSKQELLKTLGFADSKTLTEEQREKLFELIKSTPELGWHVDIISPEEISDKMLRTHKVSLNEISHLSAMGLVQKALDRGVNVTDVFVDTVGTAEYYQAKLQRNFPGINFTVTKKADSLFPIVSAASICAKVERDHALNNWSYVEVKKPDHVFGSGYPGDDDCKKWLENNLDPVFGFPTLVRFSWSTAKKLMEEKGRKVDWYR